MTPTLSEEGKRDLMLVALRSAKCRINLLNAEIDEVGVSLKLNMIDAETAVRWMHEIGGLQFVNLPPVIENEVAA
jgi:hypothetical protein